LKSLTPALPTANVTATKVYLDKITVGATYTIYFFTLFLLNETTFMIFYISDVFFSYHDP